MKAKNVLFHPYDHNGAIHTRVTHNQKFQLKRLEVKVDDTPTDSEDFTLTYRNLRKPTYDTYIYKRDLSVGSVTDIVAPFGDGWEYDKDDVIDIDYANTGGDRLAIRLVTELLED